MELSKNGKIVRKHDTFVPGVTPAMMVWYSCHRTPERYRKWHPDHLDFKVLYKPENTHVGSVYQITERMGKYILHLRTTVTEISDTTFAGDHWASWDSSLLHYHNHFRMVFEQTSGGTIMHSDNAIGSDNPIYGRFWNWVTRRFLYSPSRREANARHQKEEGVSWAKFLPPLYAEATDKEEHYK